VGVLAPDKEVKQAKNDAQDVIDNATLNNTLNNLRMEAILYYDVAQSYQGFCTSAEVQTPISDIHEKYATEITCNARDQAYAISATLLSDGYYCIDNEGAADIVSTHLGADVHCGGSGSADIAETNNANVYTQTLNPFSFLSNEYTQAFTFPEEKNDAYTADSYEWLTNGEALSNWSSIITTHKITFFTEDDNLSAKEYAQRTADLHMSSGATLIEASYIEDVTFDSSNPPYLLMYAYISGDNNEVIEFSIQKVIKSDSGSITAFIYSERGILPKEESLTPYLSDTAILELRNAVINSEFPY
jgi:hypothetical protein